MKKEDSGLRASCNIGYCTRNLNNELKVENDYFTDEEKQEALLNELLNKHKLITLPPEEPEWVETKERVPERETNKAYSQVLCLCYRPSHGIEILAFNHQHNCWDGADLDDYCCDIYDVEFWMPLPELPKKEN